MGPFTSWAPPRSPGVRVGWEFGGSLRRICQSHVCIVCIPSVKERSTSSLVWLPNSLQAYIVIMRSCVCVSVCLRVMFNRPTQCILVQLTLHCQSHTCFVRLVRTLYFLIRPLEIKGLAFYRCPFLYQTSNLSAGWMELAKSLSEVVS